MCSGSVALAMAAGGRAETCDKGSLSLDESSFPCGYRNGHRCLGWLPFLSWTINRCTDAPRPHVTVDHFLGTKGTLHDWGYRVVEAHWTPAPTFFEGINDVRQHDAAGHRS